MILCKNCSPRKECFCYQNGETRTECKFYKPMTEQEYIQTCNTEQLAEELLAWWIDGADTYNHFGLFQHEIDGAKEKIMKWLKEKHNG